MLPLRWILSVVSWAVWWYPFFFLAPHSQKRASVTAVGATSAGLLLECLAIFIAFFCRLPEGPPSEWWRIVGFGVCVPVAIVLMFTSVRYLGRQFRINAGLYEDHQLVTGGPYGIVRHPIYTSLGAMLVSTLFLFTRWQWVVPALALFVAGTEIRVYTEDGLLASRFGERFLEYKRRVPAYLPFVR